MNCSDEAIGSSPRHPFWGSQTHWGDRLVSYSLFTGTSSFFITGTTSRSCLDYASSPAIGWHCLRWSGSPAAMQWLHSRPVRGDYMFGAIWSVPRPLGQQSL